MINEIPMHASFWNISAPALRAHNIYKAPVYNTGQSSSTGATALDLIDRLDAVHPGDMELYEDHVGTIQATPLDSFLSSGGFRDQLHVRFRRIMAQ
jgi:hypothetical protein